MLPATCCSERRASSTKRPTSLGSIRFQLEACSLDTVQDFIFLFSEHSQQLHTLNDSSALLAKRLLAGATIPELETELAGLGIDDHASTDWVLNFLSELSRLGLLTGQAETDPEARVHQQKLEIAGLAFVIEYSSADLLASIGGAFASTPTSPSPVHARYVVDAHSRFVLIGKKGSAARVVDASLAAVLAKGMI